MAYITSYSIPISFWDFRPDLLLLILFLFSSSGMMRGRNLVLVPSETSLGHCPTKLSLLEYFDPPDSVAPTTTNPTARPEIPVRRNVHQDLLKDLVGQQVHRHDEESGIYRKNRMMILEIGSRPSRQEMILVFVLNLSSSWEMSTSTVFLSFQIFFSRETKQSGTCERGKIYCDSEIKERRRKEKN